MIPYPGPFLAGVVIFAIITVDAFEAVILPRRVTRRLRLTRLFFWTTWTCWKLVSKRVPSPRTREGLAGSYGPIAMLALIGLWAVGLVIGFALMQYGAGSALEAHGTTSGFWTDTYMSGTTFFTLGLGDVIPRSPLARLLVVTEGGFGFAFLAAMIGYLPFIYGSFSKREVDISLLDARAGTPPTAGELLRRHSDKDGPEALRELLKDWELWSAELMESHLSYPMLAYFRSQHDNQSWIGALTAILDTCALLRVGIEGMCVRQAELTFAIARHAVVDLSQVFGTPPKPLPYERLTSDELRRMREVLTQHGLKLREGQDADQSLAKLRDMYEPYAHALASYLDHALPPWIPKRRTKDNWQTTAWAKATDLFDGQSDPPPADPHF